MAALVQTYPQQSGPVAMLQPRPSPPATAGQQYMGGVAQGQRHSFHGLPGGMSGPAMYRPGPIQPYAFTSTPSLNTNMQWQQSGSFRATSSPSVPTMRSFDAYSMAGRTRQPHNASMPNLIYNPSMGLGVTGSRDDSSLPQARTVTPAPRPQSAYMSSTSTQVSFAQATPVRASPDRYRRSQQHFRPPNSATPSGSGMAAVSHLYGVENMNDHKSGPAGNRKPSFAARPNSYYGTPSMSAVDDTQLYRQPSQEEAKRLRRRSMHTLDSADYPNPLTPQVFRRPEESPRPDTSTRNADREIKSVRLVSNSSTIDNNSTRARNDSSESLVSTRSSHSRSSSAANRESPVAPGNPAASITSAEDSPTTPDSPKLVSAQPRDPSNAGRRTLSPSPLSRPVAMTGDAAPEDLQSSASDAIGSAPQSPSSPSASNSESPAAKHLAAIRQGVKSKSKTSRLRRAFSFGSAAEFRKAGVTDTADEADKGEPSKLHKEPSATELYDAEQARIVKKQEEGGIGASIYGARLFSGSTDNLSISSTASSASIMIRKMGRGVKRSTRSLVGLFRPKSVVGSPSADAVATEATTQPAVSMITVEAERERVNVNADPHTQPGGGTGFPHLERNSIDAAKEHEPSIISVKSEKSSERVGSSGTDNSPPRKNIVGGDKERAEVLAAVRRGILKHSHTAPVRSVKTAQEGDTTLDLPGVPNITDSPSSSAPSTPNDDIPGHKRAGSVAIGNEDYFVSALRLRQDAKSAPGTLRGLGKRSATFSPRIVFYDTWPSQEYDRRGDIATCNRLTPMLAQQIKEELNTFKMEMEVHENSKIYTHFF